MTGITTHVLDTTRGRPGVGIPVSLSSLEADGRARLLTQTSTNADGRTDAPLLAGDALQAGRYELIFALGTYFADVLPSGAIPFLDLIPIRFTVTDVRGHYHVPLLVSPWSYSTYRGS